MLILGLLAMAGEFRHDTATSTFLVTPNRGRVVGAKLAASGLVGLAFAAGAAVLTVAVAVPWLSMKDVDTSLLSGDIWVVLAGAIAVTALSRLGWASVPSSATRRWPSSWPSSG